MPTHLSQHHTYPAQTWQRSQQLQPRAALDASFIHNHSAPGKGDRRGTAGSLTHSRATVDISPGPLCACHHRGVVQRCVCTGMLDLQCVRVGRSSINIETREEDHSPPPSSPPSSSSVFLSTPPPLLIHCTLPCTYQSPSCISIRGKTPVFIIIYIIFF